MSRDSGNWRLRSCCEAVDLARRDPRIEQAVFGREPNNEFAINISEGIRRQNKTAIVLARQRTN